MSDLNFYDLFALNLANALHEKDAVESFLRLPSGSLYWRSPITISTVSRTTIAATSSAWTLEFLDVDISTMTPRPAAKIQVGLFLKDRNNKSYYAKAEWGPSQVEALVDSLSLDFEDLNPVSFAKSTSIALQQQDTITSVQVNQEGSVIDRVEIPLSYKDVGEVGSVVLLPDTVCPLDKATMTMIAINTRRFDTIQQEKKQTPASYDDDTFLKEIEKWRAIAVVSPESDGSSSVAKLTQEGKLTQESQSVTNTSNKGTRRQLTGLRRETSRRKKRKGLSYAK